MRMPHLAELAVRYHRTTSISHFAPLLSKSGFKRLHIKNRSIVQAGSEGFFLALASPDAQLEALDLSGSYFGRESAESVGTALAKNRSLRELDLSNTTDEQETKYLVHSLSSALPQNQTLRVLRMRYLDLDFRDVKWLFQSLLQNVGLSEIDLRDNEEIGEIGAREVVRVVHELQRRAKRSMLVHMSHLSCEERAALEAEEKSRAAE